jgi:antimicrobial peptide system SdpB family protein
VLTRLGARLRTGALARSPFTNVYGLARTLLAAGTLGTLLFSSASDIFRPAVGIDAVPSCPAVASYGLFCLAGGDNLEVARWIAVAVLAVVASGWRPRWTGVAHWYVSASLFTSGVLVDGGDSVTGILTLLLVPATLADPRRWHWDAPPPEPADGLTPGAAAGRLAAVSSLWLVRLQMAGIYFHAAVSKMAVDEWRDGTGVYYWFTDPWFGLSPSLRDALLPLLAVGPVVAAMTWGALVLEVFLFTGLVAERRYRRVLLVLGVAFHLAIAFVHGLPSFALAMWGGLVVYLHPRDEPLVLRVPAWARRLATLAPPALRLPRRAPALAAGDPSAS